MAASGGSFFPEASSHDLHKFLSSSLGRLLLHAEKVLGRGGVLIVVLGGTPLLLSLHHSEVPLRELLCEAASEERFNRHQKLHLG